MVQIRTHRLSTLFFVFVMTLLVGCSKLATIQPATGGVGYTGALDTAYEGAPDVTTLLALGTLRLENTGDAVSEEQAARLLPLWKSLQGGVLQGDSERGAVVRQIEKTMSEAQVSAIAAMRLTQEDVQAWAQSQGGRSDAPGNQGAGGQRPGGQPGQRGIPSGMTEEQIAQMRQQFENMSPEERATRRAQFGAQGRPGGATVLRSDVSSGGLIGAVVALLSERAGVPAASLAARPRTQRPSPTPTPPTTRAAARMRPTATPEPTPTPTVEQSSVPTSVPEPTATATITLSPTPEPAIYLVQAGDTLATIARAYGVTAGVIVEANGIQDPNLIYVGQKLIIPNAAQIPVAVSRSASPAGGGSTQVNASSPTSTYAPALKRLPDNDPGPPFTIEVSANRATQDPLVERSQTYKITGIVRNDGDRTYAVSAIRVTFFDASGFRGTFIKFPRVPGGEWVWHGVTEADFASLLLAPGEEWPFSVEITAQDMASFLIHPDAVATGRESAPVELSDVRLSDEGTDYLRINGVATNGNPLKVKNVTVSGVLLDAGGQIVSLGSTYVLQEDIEPGESVSFDVRIKKEPYVRYQLYAQAERDWR